MQKENNLPDHIMIASSNIHGKGAFTTQPISQGSIIGVTEDPQKTYFGSYVNHANQPNCYKKNGELIALKDIAKNDELTVIYRDWVKY